MAEAEPIRVFDTVNRATATAAATGALVNIGAVWLEWETAKSLFTLLSTATQLSKQPKDVQAVALVEITGEEGRKAYRSFKFETEDDESNDSVHTRQFEGFYGPANNFTFQGLRFGSWD